MGANEKVVENGGKKATETIDMKMWSTNFSKYDR